MMNRNLYLSLAVLVLPLAGAFGAAAHFSLGIPTAPEMHVPSNGSAPTEADNPWLTSNSAYAVMSVVTPGTNATSAVTVAGMPKVKLSAAEAGFVLERTKPEYYLGERINPPDGVDWPATYERFLADSAADSDNVFLFDPAGEAVYVAAGGIRTFTWVLANGDVLEMSYVVASSCKGRPRRIYWTDHPHNAPCVDLAGKFVKFFGSSEILTPTYSDPTTPGGPTNIVKGLYIDINTHMLNACGGIEGQVVMAYYDTGMYKNLLHVQTVEVCSPQVNVLRGEIGQALRPDGRGFNTTGLRARPTVVNPTDNRGDYLYQHNGQYSYSPKNGDVFPLRPTVECSWNAEIYWMETDEMEVQWPFELDHYECDWPKDATVFVRGDVNGDGGRPIYIPSDYSAALMSYQEPEGHARAPVSDGTFTTGGEGYSLLRLTADDNIWFVPIHSVFRSNTNYFTLAESEVTVGSELRLRDGSSAGTADGFSPACDPMSPGSIYEATSARIWNPNLYVPAQPDSGDSSSVDPTSMAASGGDTNTYDSVIYAVTANAHNPHIEVWWNTTIQAEDMPAPITIPTLPQVYSVKWPKTWEAPDVVIASQLGSAGESYFTHNRALSLGSVDSTAKLDSRPYFSNQGGTLTFWVKIEPEFSGAGTASLITLQPAGNTAIAMRLDLCKYSQNETPSLVLRMRNETQSSVLSADLFDEAMGGWFPVAISFKPDSATVFIGRHGHDMLVPFSFDPLLRGTVNATIGAVTINDVVVEARAGVSVGEVTFWSVPIGYASGMDAATVSLRPKLGTENGISGLYSFRDDDSVVSIGSEQRYAFTERVLGIRCMADNCTQVEKGPPLLDTAVITADASFTPRVYVQNDDK